MFRKTTLLPGGHQSVAADDHKTIATDRFLPGTAHNGTERTAARAAFTPPRLEPLGAWSALTLQQSIPIGPGNW